MKISDNITDLKVVTGYVISALIIIIAFLPSIITKNRFVGDSTDVLANTMPYLFLKDNIFSLWNNLWIGGFPEIASPMSDRFYPLSWIFPVLADNIFYINLAIILSLIISLFTIRKFLGLIIKNNNLLLFSSILYVFSGIVISRVVIGHIFLVFAFAWIPLLYYYFGRVLYSKEYNVWNIAGIAISSALIYFTGAVYCLIYAYIIIGVFLLYHLYANKSRQKIAITTIIALFLASLLVSVKNIPTLFLSDNVIRIDPIDPLKGGGLIEQSISSFVLGTPFEGYGFQESTVLIGIIPVIFIIIALVFGKKNITVPSFLAIAVSFIFADGGNTLLSFIHLFPVIDTFRCPARIFGALLPLMIFLSVYGIDIVNRILKEKKNFNITKEQKQTLKYGILVLVLIKLLELPFQKIPEFNEILLLSFFIALIAMIYCNKLDEKLFSYYVLGSLLICAIIMPFYSPYFSEINPVYFIAIVIVLLSIYIASEYHDLRSIISSNLYTTIYLLSLFVVIAGSIGYIGAYSSSDPGLEDSPANEIVDIINTYPSENNQITIMTTGWPYQHIDFTYIFMKNGMHPLRAYYAYYLNSIPDQVYIINGTQYFYADYIVDTIYLDEGKRTIENATFSVENISVFKPENVLPNAFVLRGNSIVNSEITKFSPDEVTLKGDFKKGDIVVLKTKYYDGGWKVNNRDAVSLQGLVGGELNSDTGEVNINYDPLDFKTGLFLSILGIITLIVLIVKRREINRWLNK